MDSKGLLLCARYSVAPNYFGYCGPDENRSLIDHLKENVVDSEVIHILKEFETLYPYLQLIARENKISDPFNEKVVEAYWLGNNLLQNVSNSNYLIFLREKLNIEKKLGNNKFFPHHAFHVFNIFKRTGKVNSNNTLETMDECRIGWGRVVKYQMSNCKNQNDISKIKYIFIKTKQLTINNQQLSLCKPIMKEIKLYYKNKSFIKNLTDGDFVSFHWGMICDKLTQLQIRNLEFYTQKAIDFYNL